VGARRPTEAADRVAASELAEYAYCPRAWWYRSHPPAEGPDPRSVRAADRGVRFHARTLRAEARRDRWAGALVVLLLVALALIAWILVGGGVLP